MHASKLVELAAHLATHGAWLLRGSGHASTTSIHQYWMNSRCRFDRWARSMKRHQEKLEAIPAGSHKIPPHSPGIRGVIEEVFTGEVLARVWTGIAAAADHNRGERVLEPTARSVLVTHLEARHRALKLLVHPLAFTTDETIQLNSLRRRSERWTDLLIGHLLVWEEIDDVSSDPDRARDFADDLRRDQRTESGRHSWPIVLASVRAAFHQGLTHPSPNADLNAKIGGAVLACIPAEMVDSTNLVQSLWQIRLNNYAADAQGLVDELISVVD